MSDSVQIALIVAVCVLVVLIVFRNQIKNFFFRAGPGGVETKFTTKDRKGLTDPKTGVTITGNRQVGKKNQIGVERGGVNVSDNLQKGEEQKINVKSDKPKQP